VPWLFRPLEKMGRGEKAMWTAIMFAFLLLELRTLYLDRGEHDREQAYAECEQLERFGKIAEGLQSSIDISKSQYSDTIGHVDDVLKKTQKVASVARDTLKNLTGEDSVAYLAPQSPSEDGSVPLAIVNPGKYPLTGVTVVVRDVTTLPVRESPVVTVGTLAPHLVRPLDMRLTPIPGLNPPGVASFTVSIYAQNGSSEELLQFRKGKKMLWDNRAQITRLAPVPHSMLPKSSEPESDIPGFKFSYGWLEDRPISK